MIHRAVLGSVERMIAILTEDCAGKWYRHPHDAARAARLGRRVIAPPPPRALSLTLAPAPDRAA